MRIVVLRKEKVAFIKLRRLGYQQAHIAKAFGRSLSTINRILKVAIARGILRREDLRKFHPQQRMARTTNLWLSLLKWLPAWSSWIISDEGKPP